MLAVRRHGSPSVAFRPDNLNVCVFVTTYMIAFHSSVFFEDMGTLEQSLLGAATRLLELFLSICKQLRAHKAFRHVPSEATQHFVPALWDFVKLFHAWKGPDNTKLIGRVRHALLALYNAERQLSPDLPAGTGMRLDFNTHIERLRAKLEELAGSEALRDIDTRRPATTVVQRPMIPLPVQMSNDVLTHEILVDPQFQFREKDLADDSTFGKVCLCAFENQPHTDTCRQSCWALIEAELRQTPPCYLIAFRVICQIKSKLCDLSPVHKPRLDEAVDSGRIRQQVDAGTYRWASCVGLVGSLYAVVRRLCPPCRKQATESAWDEVRGALGSPTALGLKFLSKCVDDLRLDAANERLRLIAPEIKDHGVDYERGRFRDNVDSGVYTLECMTTALQEAVDQALEGNATTLEELRRGSAQAFTHVYLQMMRSLVLVEHAPPLLDQHCPETLRFDLERINDLRAEFMELTTRAAMLTTLKHAFRAQPAVLDAVIDALGASNEAVVSIGNVAARMNVPPVVRSELLCNLTQCASPESGVRRLM